MVLYKGKDITQEEFDKILQDSDNAIKLSKANEKKMEELQVEADKAKKLGEYESKLKEREAEIFKMKLSSRLSTVEKYIASKDNDNKLIQKLGEMSDEDFELFAEGKTNDSFTSKDEIESAKKDLEEKTKELIENKDKLVADAIKNLEEKNKKATDQKIIPPTETKDMNEGDTTDKKYPLVDKIKDIYKLSNNPSFDISDIRLKKAESYINNYLELQSEEN